MATIAQEQERRSGCNPVVVTLGFGVILFIALLVLASGLPALNDHAQDKHGTQAVDAWQYINNLPGKDFCKWKCPDGRTRYMCNIRGTNDWAVAVVEGDDTLITAFLATQHYARGLIESAGCNANPLRYNHP